MPRDIFIEESNTWWINVPDDVTDEEVRQQAMAGMISVAEEAELSEIQERLSDPNLEEINGRSNKDPNLEEIYGRSNKDPNLEERLSDPNLEEIYGRSNKDPNLEERLSDLNLEEIYGRPNKDPRTGGEYPESIQEAIEKPEPETTASFQKDFLRVLANTAMAIPRFATQIGSGVVELIKDEFRDPSKGVEKDEKTPDIVGQAATSLFRAFERNPPDPLSTPLLSMLLRDINPEDIIDSKTGKVKTTETGAGLVLNIASYLATGVGAFRAIATHIPQAPALLNTLLSSVAVDQLLSDPVEGNFANMAELIPEDSSFNFVKELAIVEYLTSEEDDNILLQRAKMGVSTAVIEVLGVGLLQAGVLIARTGRKTVEDFKAYVTANKSEVAEDILKLAKDSLRVMDKDAIETDEGFAQVIAMRSVPFNKNAPGGGPLDLGTYFTNFIKEPIGNVPILTRAKQRFLTSRGYLTPKGFEAKRKATTEKRVILSKAAHIGNRLTLAINRIKDQANGGDKANKILLNAQEALSQNMSDVFGYTGKGKNKVSQFDSWTPEKRIKKVGKEFKIPEDVAEEILNARVLIDDLSKTLLDSTTVSAATTKSIKANIGEYLTRSYKFYDDISFTPSEDAKNKAIQFLVNSKVFGGKQKTQIKSATRAIERLLENKNLDDFGNYAFNQRLVDKGILKHKKDIAEPIRELLGEVKDPIENIMLTINKLGSLTTTLKFYDTMLNLGRGGRSGKGPNKYIFKQGDVGRDPKIFNTKIEGTGSVLDGRYTTPEMSLAIRNLDTFVFFSGAASTSVAIRAWAGASGLAQKQLTVYSHQAQQRNVLGGMQFGLQNGWLPFTKQSGEGGVDSLKILWKELRKTGDKEFDAFYEEMQGLGVINTSVKGGEYRSLIRTFMGEEAVEGPSAAILEQEGLRKVSSDLFSKKAKRLGDITTETFEKIGFSRGMQALPENIYLAVDDFFKMNMYKKELKALKNIHPEESVEVLKLKAARIVKNGVPNYDLIPPAIKALRNVPFGSFVAFPSEVIRTTVYITKQASEEIALGLKGNKAALRRGTERLTGLVAAHAGWQAGGYGVALAAGYTWDQFKGWNIALETKWNKNHNRWISRDSDGNPISLDTTFLNAGDTISAPVLKAMHLIQSGKLKGEALDAYLWDAMFKLDPSDPGALLTVLKPYVSEAVLTKALLQVGQAYLDENGRASDGLKLFDKYDNNIDKFGSALKHITKTIFVPGTFRSFYQVGEAIAGTPNASTGAPRDLRHEVLANTLGIRWRRVSSSDALDRAITQYLVETKYNEQSIKPNFRTTPEKFVEDASRREEGTLKAAKELYRKIKAVESIGELNREAIIERLMEKNISEVTAVHLVRGMYTPREDLNDIAGLFFDTFRKKRTGMPTKKYEDFLIEHQKEYWRKSLFSEEDWEEYMAPPSLLGAGPVDDDDDDDDDDDERDNFDKGGLVLDVPNVPKEPDERIDKVTGLPYNIQAGEAFIDNDDDPLKRMGFGKGGSVYEATKEKVGEGYRAFNKPSASKTMEYLADKGLGIDAKQLRQHEGEAAKIVNEALEKGIVNPDWVKKLEITKGGLLKGGQKVGDVFNAVNHALLSYKYNDRPGLLQAKEVVQGIFDEPEDSIQASLIDAWNNKAGFAIANRVKNKEGAKNEILRLLEQREDKLFKGEELIAGEDLFFAREEISVIRGLLK